MKRLFIGACGLCAMLAVRSIAHGDASAKSSATLAHAAFRGEPGWFVIGEVFRKDEEVGARVGERWAQGISVSPVTTDYFLSLRHGFVALVYGSFPDRDAALARSAQLKQQGIRTDVKASGALAADAQGKKRRLIRLWGRLEEDSIRMPARIDVDEKTISTDRHGWYETWLAVGAEEANDVEFVPTDLKMKNRPKECTDWFDKGGIKVHFKATDLELHVSWTPQPDCSGE